MPDAPLVWILPAGLNTASLDSAVNVAADEADLTVAAGVIS